MNPADADLFMTASEAAQALGATMTGPDAPIRRVIIDSRLALPGDLFVALNGARDGHDFATKAVQSGAVAVLVQRPLPEIMVSQIVVADTRIALGRLAQWWRRRFSLPVVALTGSNGKTTTKEMLRAILSEQAGDARAVLATEGNLNNDLGVPLTLFGLRPHHRYAVIEMGMNHLGEIDYVTHLAEPDVALVINAGTAHIGELGSREAIARAKGEIYGGLREGGTAVINMHDRFGDYWHELVETEVAAGRLGRITFGILPVDDVQGVFGEQSVEVRHGGDSVTVRLAVPGEHNLRNALAACAAAIALGVPLGTLQTGLAAFGGVKGRMQALPGEGGARVIHDAYNANPDSVRAAIDVLAALPGRRLLVLGDMGELGPDEVHLHAEIGDYVRGAGLDGLFAMGRLTESTVMQAAARAWHFDDLDELCAELRKHMDEQTTVLVKGSRFMKMERVVEQIAVGFDANDGGAH